MIKKISFLPIFLSIIFFVLSSGFHTSESDVDFPTYPEVLFQSDAIIKGNLHRSGNNDFLTIKKKLHSNGSEDKAIRINHTYPISDELHDRPFLNVLIRESAHIFCLDQTEDGEIKLKNLTKIVSAAGMDQMSYTQIESDMQRILQLLEYDTFEPFLNKVHDLYIIPIKKGKLPVISKHTLSKLSQIKQLWEPVRKKKREEGLIFSRHDRYTRAIRGSLIPLRDDKYDRLSWFIIKQLTYDGKLLSVPILLEEVPRSVKPSQEKSIGTYLASHLNGMINGTGTYSPLDKAHIPVDHINTQLKDGDITTTRKEYSNVEKRRFVQKWKLRYRKMLPDYYDKVVSKIHVDFLHTLKKEEGEVYQIAYNNYVELFKHLAGQNYYPLDKLRFKGAGAWNRHVASEEEEYQIPDKASDNMSSTGRDGDDVGEEEEGTGNRKSTPPEERQTPWQEQREREKGSTSGANRTEGNPAEGNNDEDPGDQPIPGIATSAREDGDMKRSENNQKPMPYPLWPFVLLTLLGAGTLGMGYVFSTRG